MSATNPPPLETTSYTCMPKWGFDRDEAANSTRLVPLQVFSRNTIVAVAITFEELPLRHDNKLLEETERERFKSDKILKILNPASYMLASLDFASFTWSISYRLL